MDLVLDRDLLLSLTLSYEEKGLESRVTRTWTRAAQAEIADRLV